MIRRLFIKPKLVAVLVAVSCCISLQAVNTITYNANYDFSSMTTSTDTLGGVTYATISYGDLFNGGAPGAPALPIDYIRFSVPWNATNFTVSTLLRNTAIDNINRLVYPCQAPRLMNDTTPVTITLPDSSIYYTNAYYPSQNAWVVDEGFLAGENHIVTVAVMPISYKHGRMGNQTIDLLKKSETVRITLSYQLSDSLPMYPIVRQDSDLRQEGYALARSLVVNPTNVEAYAPVVMELDNMETILPNSGDGLNGGPTPHINPDNPPIPNDSIANMGGELQINKFPYLIITTPELFHSVRRIAALKRQKGYGVKVVTIGDVLDSPEAGQGDVVNHELIYADDAGKLRQYLKYCYRRYGTQYVLLAGNGIPYRTVPHTYDTNTQYNLDFELISDLYYSDLNGNWTSEEIEYHPELYVGRILSHGGEQIDNYTDKLLRYELNPGNGEYSYLKKAFHSQGRDFYVDAEYPKAINELKDIFPYQTIINDTIGSVSKYPKGSDIINSLNSNRVGFASIFNHSDSTRMRVYGRDIDTTYYIYTNTPIQQGEGLNCLTNKQYPMIFYAPTCVSVPFDYTGGMCFGEVFTTGKDYGGPVYIGYTRTIISLGATPLFKHFARRIKEGYYKLGVADALSKVYRTEWTLNEIISHAYLGDPELELWTDIPQLFSNSVVTRNNNSITVSGLDLNSTIVAIYNNDGEVRQITTNSLDTNITFNANPNSTIMLYKHNYMPYIAPLVLQNISMNHSQYVIASDVVAGNAVDSVRTSGSVTVKEGVEYEIEASGTVTLQGGFNVEKGATFAVYPSSF